MDPHLSAAAAATRERAILSLRLTVEIEAGRACRRLPSTVLHKDLLAAAWLGALAGVDRFKPGHGAVLKTYAKWKIQGAIGDYLRLIDPLTRGHRTQVKGAQQDDPLAADPSVPVDLDDLRVRRKCANGESPEDAAVRRDTAEDLRARLWIAVQTLEPQNRKLIQMYFWQEMTLKQIAKGFGITEGACSQRKGVAFAQLRVALGPQ